MAEASWLKGVLSSITSSRDPISEPDSNIVQHPSASLDAQAKAIHALENQLVDCTAELGRHAKRYNTIRSDLIKARETFAKTLTDSGVRVEFIATPPELEL